MTLPRGLAAIVAAAGAALCVAALPVIDGPPWLSFFGFMLLPIAAALAIAPRTVRFAFIAGALYSALAGLRRILVPEGNETAAEQLSTAALVSLLIPIVAMMWRWAVRMVLYTNRKGG